MEIKQEIRSFFQQHVDPALLNDDVDVFKHGLVSSLWSIQLVVFLEKTFNISVAGEDMDLENFNSINNIERYVKRKIAEN